MSDRQPDRRRLFRELQAELEKCIRCGECRTVCPVFASELKEGNTARGKIALLRAAARGELELSGSFRESLGNCLLCLACVDNCSNQTPTDLLVLAGRAAFFREQGASMAQAAICKGLASGDAVLGTASRLQRLLFRRLPERSGMRRRFPLPLIDGEQVVPRLVERSFRSTFSGRETGRETRDRVVFFTGCMSNYAYVSVAEAVVRVMDRLDVEVAVPGEQQCCGAPMFFSGDVDTARRLALANLECLEGDATVVVPCSSCGLMLRQHYPDLLGQEGEDDQDTATAARSLSARVMDISEYLVHRVGTERIAAAIVRPLDEAATWHDPCHLRRGQGVHEEPRTLLDLACGRYVEMDDADRCCGMAGTYGLTHPRTSRAIQKDKMESVRRTGADLVATACPACTLQLTDGLRRYGVKGRALHVIEVLARAMGE